MAFYGPNPNFTVHLNANEAAKLEDVTNSSINRGVFCATYKLNKCGSKVISIGIDISQDCKSFVNIGNGSASVNLTEKGWRDFLLYTDYFDYYFDSGIAQECWELNPNIKFYASEVFKKKSIILHGSQRVIMQEMTWRGLKQLIPCVNVVLDHRIAWENSVKKYLNTIITILQEEVKNYTGANIYEYLLSMLHNMPGSQPTDFLKHLHIELITFYSQFIVERVLQGDM